MKERHRAMFMIRMLILVSMLLGACSGSNSSPPASAGAAGAATVAAAGTVNTTEIGGTGLTVVSVYGGDSSVGQGGGFATTVSLGSTQLVFVIDGTGALRGLTLSVGGGAPLQVDGTSTALGLLFLTPGLITLDPTETQARIAQLGTLPYFVSLVNFLRTNLPTQSLEALKAGPDLPNLLLACIQAWVAMQPPSQPAASFAVLALPSSSTPLSSSALGALQVPNPSSSAETAGHVRLTLNATSADLSNIPVRIDNAGWRFVRLFKKVELINGISVVAGPTTLVPLSNDLGGATSVSLGSLATGTVGAPSTGSDTLLFGPEVFKVQYWIVGPGSASLPSGDMPADSKLNAHGGEHGIVINDDDFRLARKTFIDYVAQPILGTLGKDGPKLVKLIVDSTVTAPECFKKLAALDDPTASFPTKGAAFIDIMGCLFAVLENDPFIAKEIGKAFFKNLNLIDRALMFSNSFVATVRWAGTPHVALIEVVKEKTGCLDPFPEVLQPGFGSYVVVASATPGNNSLFTQITGGFPVSATVSNVDGSASATGGKGNMTVSARADEVNTDSGGSTQSDAVMHFRETVLITAPGRTGFGGQLTFNPNVSASAVIESCEYISPIGNPAGAGPIGGGKASYSLLINSLSRRSGQNTCNPQFGQGGDANDLPITLNFSYGVPFGILFDMSANELVQIGVRGTFTPRISVSSSLGISYNENSFQIVNQPPDTKITFCRAVP